MGQLTDDLPVELGLAPKGQGLNWATGFWSHHTRTTPGPSVSGSPHSQALAWTCQDDGLESRCAQAAAWAQEAQAPASSLSQGRPGDPTLVAPLLVGACLGKHLEAPPELGGKAPLGGTRCSSALCRAIRAAGPFRLESGLVGAGLPHRALGPCQSAVAAAIAQRLSAGRSL